MGEAMITRTSDEIRTMIGALTYALDHLPDTNAFGGSNLEEKFTIFEWRKELEAALNDGKLPTVKDEVYDWLTGKDIYELTDFLA
jgi:hypothetical protein